MAEKLFAFRWDVDHRACLTDGVPRIREVCRALGVRNTFFVNLGRSTNLREWLGGVATSRAKLADRESVHLIAKIGWRRFLVETLRPRPVGLSFLADLRALQAEGHELGLHGGMDHVVWSRRFPELPAHVLEADVAESHRLFSRSFGRPAGFASPGFRSDARVMEILERLDYRYDTDAIGGEPRRARAGERTLRHWTIPVTLAGPRTIPFVEWQAARGAPEADIVAGVARHLAERERVVVYGHPCYEGVRAPLLRRIFETALHAGFRFVTLREIADRCEREARRAAA
jgi:peptidoglycan/xylan/chitin deacetylase (PgdA/CDA1 family)